MTGGAGHRALDKAIGLVYDSAIDVTVWPAALEALAGLIDGCYGAISVMDTDLQALRLNAEWCPDPDWPRWRKLLEEQYANDIPFYKDMPDWEVGAVYNTAQMAAISGITDIYEHRFFKEWALPLGRRDTLACLLMKSPKRFGLFNIHTSIERDLIGPRDLALGAMIAPHVRRAVHIGDVLGMANARAETLQSTLDTLKAAVVVTDARARVVLCNRAGEAMLKAGAPLSTQDGQLRAAAEPATQALLTAISQTVDPLERIAGTGIGVPLRADDGSPAIAYVLPLARGTPRRDGGPHGTAAVFVAPVDYALPEADALIAIYGLTPTEARVTLQIAAGKRRAEAAAALGISDNTVKTHLDRVYSKTGTSDQSALAGLVASLASPGRVGR